MNRRKLLKNALGSSALLAFGVPTLAQQKSRPIPVDLSKRKVPKIKITKFDVMMTGRNEYVRLETDSAATFHEALAIPNLNGIDGSVRDF